jgi:hypothetical protein
VLSTTTTTSAPTTTTTIPIVTTTTAPVRVADLSACPKDNPDSGLTRLNAGSDLTTDLVPIDALNVRICKYRAVGNTAPLLGISWLALSVAQSFTADTNQLRSAGGPNVACTKSAPKTSFFLTFAVDAQAVNLYAGGCPAIVSNGTLTARMSARWRRELAQYTNQVRVTPAAP